MKKELSHHTLIQLKACIDEKKNIDKRIKRKAPSYLVQKKTKERIYLYGIHTVREAIQNPNRKIHRMLATQNALSRLSLESRFDLAFEIEIVEPSKIEKIIGKESTHQGVLLEVNALESPPLDLCKRLSLVLVLDQVTDPHNIGAILRSAAVFGVEAIITTERYSPPESTSLAKAACGALEYTHRILVKNLANALEKLHEWGFYSIGLDSAHEKTLEETLFGNRIALILGSEGKGLRERTRTLANALARLDNAGTLHSLNVSNAAAISLYITRQHLNQKS